MRRWRHRYQEPLYRSRDGVILGVCRGVADYFNLRVFWVRVIMLALFLVSGVWPMVFIYLVASLLIKPEPMRPLATEGEREFYDSYTYSRARAVGRLKRRFQNLDRRIRRMEDTVTAREFDWERKIHT